MVKINKGTPEFSYEITCEFCGTKNEYESPMEIKVLYPLEQRVDFQKFVVYCDFCSGPNSFDPQVMGIDEKYKKLLFEKARVMQLNAEQQYLLKYSCQHQVNEELKF